MTNKRQKQLIELGKRIRKLREKRGLTQAMLAKKVNMSRQSIVNIEAGYRSCLLVTVFNLCDVLKVTPGILLK